jgi:hypothetical protein
MNPESLNMAEREFLKENKDKPLETLSAILKRPVAQIEFELQSIKQELFEQEGKPVANSPEVSSTPAPSTPPVDSPLLKTFARRKEGGVVAMTSAAAQMSDEILQRKGSKKNVLHTKKDCVTTVRK